MKKKYGFLSILLLVIFWYLLSHSNLIGKTLIATPEEVIDTILRAFKTNSNDYDKFYIHAFYTIKRALEGWIFGIILGALLGIFAGSIYQIFYSSEPIIEFLRAIPPILVFPLFLVAFNYNYQAYIWTIAFGCFPIMFLTVAKGTRTISKDKINLLKIYDINKITKLFIYFMEILPSVFLGARVSLSIAIVIAVVSEMVFTPKSGFAIGALARDAEINFNTPLFYTSVLTIGIIGYIINIILRNIEQKLGLDNDLLIV
jgi:ABC-type nitrate/sulfonate/bicarbonate transport system permease component